MNLIEAFKEVKNKLKDNDNIKRFMIVRRHYTDEVTKPTQLANIRVKDGNIPLDNIEISMDDLLCSDWEVMTAYKQDNHGIVSDEE
jgi:hypothetical protein